MILHRHIPTRAEAAHMLVDRDSASVSIYVPNDSALSGDAGRIEFWNLAVGRQLHERCERGSSEGRALSDIAEAARAAPCSAIDAVLVDVDEVVPGSLDELPGVVRFGEAESARYKVLDEIAGRVWPAGGRVLAVRRDDIPGRSLVAAILRYRPAPS